MAEAKPATPPGGQGASHENKTPGAYSSTATARCRPAVIFARRPTENHNRTATCHQHAPQLLIARIAASPRKPHTLQTEYEALVAATKALGEQARKDAEEHKKHHKQCGAPCCAAARHVGQVHARHEQRPGGVCVDGPGCERVPLAAALWRMGVQVPLHRHGPHRRAPHPAAAQSRRADPVDDYRMSKGTLGFVHQLARPHCTRRSPCAALWRRRRRSRATSRRPRRSRPRVRRRAACACSAARRSGGRGQARRRNCRQARRAEAGGHQEEGADGEHQPVHEGALYGRGGWCVQRAAAAQARRPCSRRWTRRTTGC